jgi:hypothetical protein
MLDPSPETEMYIEAGRFYCVDSLKCLLPLTYIIVHRCSKEYGNIIVLAVTAVS